MKKLLIVFTILCVGAFGFDRFIAYLYLPRENDTAVILYSAAWCPYCQALRNTLNQYRIPFTEHDVEKSMRGFVGFWALRARAVPVCVIGEQVIHGYNGQTVTDALIAAGYEIPASWPDHAQE